MTKLSRIDPDHLLTVRNVFSTFTCSVESAYPGLALDPCGNCSSWFITQACKFFRFSLNSDFFLQYFFKISVYFGRIFISFRLFSKYVFTPLITVLLHLLELHPGNHDVLLSYGQGLYVAQESVFTASDKVGEASG